MPQIDIIIFLVHQLCRTNYRPLLIEHLATAGKFAGQSRGVRPAKLAQLKEAINAPNLDTLIADAADEQQQNIMWNQQK